MLPCHTSTLDKDSGGNSGGDGPVHSRVDGDGGDNSRCSTLSWDAPSDLLLPPDLDGAVQLDYYSRPSSGTGLCGCVIVLLGRNLGVVCDTHRALARAGQPILGTRGTYSTSRGLMMCSYVIWGGPDLQPCMPIL